MDVSDEVAATLRAENHGHPPCVLDAAGFCTEHSAQSRSIGYEDEKSPTLRAGVVPAAVYENHSQDTRYTGPLDVAPTVSSTYGTGGNNQPFVVGEDCPKTLKIRSGCEGGGKGALIQEDKSATLSCNNDQTLFVPKAYGICSDKSNSMLSDNPHSGVYEADISRTLDANGGNPGCNQGGIAVVESYAIQGSMIGREDKNGPQGDGVNEDVSFTLNTVDCHAVFAMTTGSFTQAEEEMSPTPMARDFKDPTITNDFHTASGKDVFGTLSASIGSKQWLGNQEAFCGDYHIVGSEYTVRRLTPTECARLQGFPDWWCSGLGTAEPTMEDLRYWYVVFETHRRITGSAAKPKTLKQIAKWLKDPYSDAAEYKMWGNGVALPCVAFVLAGIVNYAQFPTQ